MSNLRVFSLVFGSLMILFNACSPKMSSTVEPKAMYPSIKDSAKIQYLTYFQNSLSVDKKQSGFNKAMIGQTAPMDIKKAYGVEFKDNKIYISDFGAKAIDIIDLETNKFEYFIPQGVGSLKVPVNACIDDDGTIYVADMGNEKIKIFDGQKQYVGSFGDDIVGPSDVNVKDGKIWVCDAKNNRINIYDKRTKKLLDYLPKAKKGEDHWLFMPTNIRVTDEEVYVTDMGSGSVKIYSHEGKFIRSVGSFGTVIGHFVRPKGIDIDKEGNIYVVDASFQNVQIFDKNGNLLLFFGGNETGKQGDMYLPAAIAISYETEKFQQYVDPDYDLHYVIFVMNQFGPYKLSVYGRVERKSQG